MNDILKMVLSALGAAAGAAAILAGLMTVGVVLTTGATANAVALLISAAPVVICAGGVAYAASQTGYGRRG